MDIASLSNAATATNSSGNADQDALIENYEAFLQILTSQLRNQSPLEPLNANEFTEQLVQYSSVEQAIKTNSALDDLITLNAAAQAANLVGYIGKQITAEGSATMLEGGEASWSIDVDEPSPETEISIRDSNGALVMFEVVNLPAGEQTYRWSGRTNEGATAPDGLYSITLAGSDGNGNRVDISTGFTGEVTGLNLTEDPAVLLVGDARVPLSTVTSVEQAP